MIHENVVCGDDCLQLFFLGVGVGGGGERDEVGLVFACEIGVG